MTMIIMIALIIVYAFIATFKSKIDLSKDIVLSADDSINLKGLWSIIILMVHVPLIYQNKLQDLIGSFAYIGVTFFFLTSSFGLMYSVEKKEKYIKEFWKKRLIKLLFPCIVINIFIILLDLFILNEFNIMKIFIINKWVILLLICYFIFYISYLIFKNNRRFLIVTNVICIIIISMITYFTNLKIAFLWPTEMYGFIYGLLLYILLKNETIKNKIFNNWNCLIYGILSLVLGLLYLKYKLIFFFGEYVLKIMLGFMLNLFILSISKMIRFGNVFTNFLGKISYEIYLIHNVVFIYLVNMNVVNNSGIFIIISILLTILFSIIVNSICYNVFILFKKETD